MILELQRPLATFDLECTGVTIGKDRIVEIAILKVFPDGKKETYQTRINPEMPIPLEVSEIHGIYDVDVLNAPKLIEAGSDIIKFMEGCDLAGFNCLKFDVPFLIEELDRVGLNYDVEGIEIVDVQNIFHKMEQRTLVAAYKFYCGKDLVNAHSAMADVDATYEVLLAQLNKYKELDKTVPFLGEFSTYGNKTMDFARRIGFDNENRPIFNFGKHKDRLVVDVFKQEKSYYAWIMNGDFARDTKNKFTQIWKTIN